jgi:membrane associated rhomboid family serine protease
MTIPNITLIVIIITCVASFYAWNNPEVYRKWMMNPYRVKNNNEYYRFITSGFIHADYMHLFFNMYSLYLFGRIAESYIGALNLVLLFLLGIIVSDLPTYFKYKNSSHYNSLGASGGVSSVIFASILIDPIGDLGLLFLPITIPGFIFGVLYLIYCYYMAKRGQDNINHDAHFYGALFGIVYTAVLFPDTLPMFLHQVLNWRMPY